MNTTIYDSIIIGAGISGLTLAYRLQSQGLSILLLEASPHVGGVMQSTILETPAGPIPIELGPNTVPSSAKEFLSLAEEVGITAIESADTAQKRYLFLNGRLTPLPTNPFSFLTSPILSPIGKLNLLQDLYRPVKSLEEITIAQFFEQRFGKEFVENILTPALTGIYAGNPEQMSLQATFPFLAKWEQEGGSVIKGAIKALKDKKKLTPSKSRAKQKLLSFQNGIGDLPQAIAKQLGQETIRLNQVVTSIQKVEQHYQVQTDTKNYQARTIVLATPADSAANIIKPFASESSNILSAIPYAPMNLIHLVFDTKTLPFSWDGFGFLIPRKQRQMPAIKLLGGIWNSCLFPDKYPEGVAVATHFQGGMFHPELSKVSDDELIEQTIQDLTVAYQTDSLKPIFTHVKRWPTAIPQYTLGHQNRMQQVTQQLEEVLPNLYLLGNYQSGISLNDCVKNANELSSKIIQTLKLKQSV